MKTSKEEFMELREWVVTMTDDVYTDLPPDWRMSFKSEKAYFPDQHNRLYETDSVYRELFSRYRKAKKEGINISFKLYDKIATHLWL